MKDSRLACSVLLTASLTVAACSTADGQSETRGPRFEEANLIVDCPSEALAAASSAALLLEDENGVAIQNPLSVDDLVEVSAPGSAVEGNRTGSILVSSPEAGDITVVVTLRDESTGSEPALTYVDRCVIEFLEAEEVPECLVDEDCDEDSLCDATTSTCVAPPPPPDCTVDLDCEIDEICDAEGSCEPIPVLGCEFAECTGSIGGEARELSGLLDCTVTEGTPPASVDIELECATTAERVTVIVGCDLFGGPTCSGAFGAQVQNEGGWSCTTVGLTANAGPAILDPEDICVLTVQ